MALHGIWRALVFGIFVLAAASVPAQDYIRNSRPELFTYDELVKLSLPRELSSELAEKLRVLTTTPFVSNEAYFAGAEPRPLQVNHLGPVLRVAFWNIERGLEIDNIKLMLTDKEKFMAKVTEERKHAKQSGKRVREVNLQKIPDEIETLKAADIWILNEVDWGVKRTDYREIVRELAETLHMNWAYGVEFLEIDSKQLGTDTFEEVGNEKDRQQLLNEFKVDKDRIRALHGNAVLSRYPIRAARLVPLSGGYDWFKEDKIRPLEKGKRKAAILVGEDLQREVRRGQRTNLLVDLDVQPAPGGVVTIAATHLENRTKPSTRRRQLEELLAQIREISHPLVLAGDMNTSGSNSTPTSIENMLYKRYGTTDFWTTQGVQWATGLGLVYTGAKAVRKLAGIQVRVDPTSKNIPGASPNLERGFFDTLERFRFADGDAFDFRGSPERSVNGKSGTLSNSNQRNGRGFAPSFVSELIWGKVRVAKFKLDWIFVKGDLKNPRDPNGTYRFFPHFGSTLSDLNNCFPFPISDHSPMTVDLPFYEPQQNVNSANQN
jgi:endonuclease/exonuclease/phosphatase family metal-dependent hydrolase